MGVLSATKIPEGLLPAHRIPPESPSGIFRTGHGSDGQELEVTVRVKARVKALSDHNGRDPQRECSLRVSGIFDSQGGVL